MSRPSFIEPLMACSTTHLKPSTMAWLLEDADDGPCIYANEYGAFIYCTDDEGMTEDYPGDLLEVYTLAREYDCVWIKFDRDAAEIDALPVYDWDAKP